MSNPTEVALLVKKLAAAESKGATKVWESAGNAADQFLIAGLRYEIAAMQAMFPNIDTTDAKKKEDVAAKAAVLRRKYGADEQGVKAYAADLRRFADDEAVRHASLVATKGLYENNNAILGGKAQNISALK